MSEPTSSSNITVNYEGAALVLKYQAKIAEAVAIINRYEDESRIISIGEHPGIIDVLEQAYEQLDKYQGLLNTYQSFQLGKLGNAAPKEPEK